MKRLTVFFAMIFLLFSFGFCPNTVYAAETHDFAQGVVMIEASCLFDGKVRYTCADCGEIKEDILPAKGHHLTSSGKNTLVCSCGYSETKIKRFGKFHQTFVCEQGVLTLETKSLENGEYVFEFCEATTALSEEYRRFYPGFSKAYLFRLELAGKPCDMTEEMLLAIPLEKEFEDFQMKLAILRSGKFYYLEDFEIKDGEIRINGEELAGAEAIFLEKGERVTMSIAVPIAVTVVTVLLAACAIHLILQKDRASRG